MKTLLRLALVLFLLFLGLMGLGFATLDGVFARAVEASGTYAMGVRTNVESADVGLFTGELSLNGLTVDNPEGFDGSHFLELRSTAFEADPATLASDKLVVPLIEFSGVTLNVERRNGQTNYRSILDNLDRFGSDRPAGEPTKPAPEASGKTLLVERIVLRDIKVTANLLPLGGEASLITLGLDELVISDLDTAGLSFEQLFSLVVNALLAATLESGQGLLPADLLADLGGRLQGLESAAFELSGDLRENVEGALAEKRTELIERATDKLEEVGGEAGKKLGEQLGSTLEEKLGGLLKKKD